MKMADLLTPKGRKATGQLAMDLTKITGKAAIAGTAGLVSTLANAAATSSFSSDSATVDSHDHDECYYSDYSGFHYSGGYKPDHD